MTKTKNIRELLTKPAQFLHEFADRAAQQAADEYNKKNSRPITAEEIQEDYYSGKVGYLDSECASNVMIDGLILREVEGHGGGEGGGDSVLRVWAVIEGAELKKSKYGPHYVGGTEIAHIRATGYYSSYNGTEWDESSPELVFPQVVSITKYYNKTELKKLEKAKTA